MKSMIKIKLLSNSEVKYKQANANWFKNLMVEFCLQVVNDALGTLCEWYKCGCTQKWLYGFFCACSVSMCPTTVKYRTTFSPGPNIRISQDPSEN